MVDAVNGKSLEDRLECIEEGVRRNRAATLAFAGLAAVVVLTAQSTKQTNVFGEAQGQHVEISATGVTMYDASRTARARLYFDSGGLPTLNMLAAGASKGGIELQASKQGGHLTMSSSAGAARIYFGTYGDDTAGLEISDPNGHIRAYTGTFKDGLVGHFVADPSGRERARIAYDGKMGEPGFFIDSPNGNDEIEAVGTMNGGYVEIEDPTGERRTDMGLGGGNDFAYVGVYDSQSRSIWKAP